MREITSRLAYQVKHFRKTIAAGQHGQAFVYVLMILTIGVLLVTGFLSYTSTMISYYDIDADRILARYAAETGIIEVTSDVIQGDDVLSPDYLVPSSTVNGYGVNISIIEPDPGIEPAAIYHYIDPGVDYGLKSLASQEHYYFRLENVSEGSKIRVNWAFTPIDERWRMKLFEGNGPLGAPDPITIAQDDFESGDWNGGSGWLNSMSWTFLGDSSVVSTGGSYQGNYHMKLSGNTGQVRRAVNLTGLSNVRLQFWAKADSIDPGETDTCSISSNGIDWTVVRVWKDGEDDNIYRFEDVDLSSFDMTSQFWVAFSSNMSDTGDYFWVDELKLISQTIPSPIVQFNDNIGPGALIVDGSLISGGSYTIDFMNDSGVSLVSSAFGSAGSADNTWIYGQAYKDYIISSTAGGVTVITYIRQVPGPTYPVTGQNIYIESWNEP